MTHYLRVDDSTANQIDVYCDGFVLRVHTDGSDAFIGQIYDPSLTDIWFTIGSKVVVGGTTYCISEDLGITVEITAQTATKVTFRIVGDFEDSSQSDLSNETGSVVYLEVYSDRIVQRTEFNATGSITLSDNAANGLCFMDSTIANITNEDSKYESTGSEADAGGDGSQASADYIATLSDECNVQGICLENTLGGGTATYVQYIDDPGVALRFGWNNGTITAASTITVMWIIDSADRELGSKKYSSVERLEIGDEQKDYDLAAATTGTWVSDLVIPKGIDDGAADGALHIDSSSHVAKFTVDRTRHHLATVLQTPMFLSGTVGSETDHLIGHWKCDDNAANTTVLDALSKVGNGVLTGGQNTSGISITDSVRNRALQFDGTDDYVVITLPTSGDYDPTNWKNAFTLIVTFRPQFAYDVSSTGYVLSVFREWNDYMGILYSQSANRFEGYSNIGATAVSANTDSPVFTSNNDLQQWHTAAIGIDLDEDFMFFAFNGKVVGTGTGLGSWVSDPTSLVLGAYRDNGGSKLQVDIDEIKLLDGCILPYGAYFTGNGSVDPDVAEKSILFYWNGSDCTASNISIGALQGTKGGSGGSFVTSGGIGNNDDYFDTESTAELHFTVTNGTHISYDEGDILCWFNIQTISDGDAIFGVGDATDYIQAVMDASGNIDVTYCSQSTTETITGDIACGTGEWHCLRITFDDSGGDVKVHSYIDGVENGTAQTIANTFSPNSSDVLYLGADYAGSNIADIFIDEFYWTNKTGTPQEFTAFGTPLHKELLEIT